MANEENLKPWKPGQSGNPSGRPKGLPGMATRCRELFDELGLPLFEKLLRGEPIEVTEERRGKVVKRMWYPTVGDRVEAAKWLADRGYGKAVQATKVLSEEDSPASNPGEEARRRLMARRAAEKAAVAAQIQALREGQGG